MSSAKASGAYAIFCGLLAGINSTLVRTLVFNKVRLIKDIFIFEQVDASKFYFFDTLQEKVGTVRCIFYVQWLIL